MAQDQDSMPATPATGRGRAARARGVEPPEQPATAEPMTEAETFTEVPTPGYQTVPPSSSDPGEPASSGSAPGGDFAVDPEEVKRAGLTGGKSSQASIASVATPIIGQVIAVLMLLVHKVRARRTGETPAWLPAPEPAEAIAEPLARIAARHLPEGVGATDDVGDVIEAGAVVVAWSVEQVGIEQAYLAGTGAPGAARRAEGGEPAPAPPPAPAQPSATNLEGNGEVDPTLSGPAAAFGRAAYGP